MSNPYQPFLSEDQVKEAARRYAAGEACAQIAPTFGCHAATVRRSLVRSGVVLRGRREARLATVGSPLLHVSPAELEELYSGGGWISLRTLAQQLGVSRDAARFGLIAAGIKIHRKPAAPKPPKPAPRERRPKPDKEPKLGHWRHGEAARGKETAEHRSWRAMKRRCFNPRSSFYENYGGRGITVCQRWADSYEAFLADMGRRPSPDHSIDRIDVNGNYEPSNCRWATSAQQSANTRKRTRK